MRKIVLFLAIALPAFALLQGCATTPGIYDEAPYAPPPGYILVPVPQGYSGYSYYYYSGPYPYQSSVYYWPFYPGYVWYVRHHRRPKPNPPCRHCGGKGGASPGLPGFIPRGKPISHFYWGDSPPPPPPPVRPGKPQPDSRRLPNADVPPPPARAAPRAAPTPPAADPKPQLPPRKRRVIPAPPG